MLRRRRNLCSAMVNMALFLLIGAVSAGFAQYTVTNNPYEGVDWGSYKPYKAALHVHSTYSDGSNTMKDMLITHYNRDYSIVTMTDHGIFTPDWDIEPVKGADNEKTAASSNTKKEKLSTDEKIRLNNGTYPRDGGRSIEGGMIGLTWGNEPLYASEEKIEYGHSFTAGAKFSYSGKATMSEVLTTSTAAGCVNYIHHPGRYTGGVNGGDAGVAASNNRANIDKYITILTSTQTLGMEIINKLDGETRSDRILYDNILKELAPKGQNVWAFSSDDAHSTDAVGYSFDVMFLPKLTQEAVFEAMRKGAFYAVARVDRLEGINVAAVGSNTSGNASTLALLGQPVPGITRVTVDKNSGVITVAGENYDKIEWIADGVKIHSDDKNAASSSTLNLNDTRYAGKIFRYVRAHLKNANGIAFTQPFYVNNPNVKINPNYTIPSGLNAVEGDALSSVILLSKNWAWVDGAETVNLQTKTYRARFTPDDTATYAKVVAEVGINVAPAGLKTYSISEFGDRYYYYSRTDAGRLESAFDMSDKTGWNEALTPVGFGAAPAGVALATTMGSGTGSNKAGASGSLHTWTYFKKEFTVGSASDDIYDISGRHRIDDALIIYINGKEVYRFNTDGSSTKIGAAVNWNAYGGNSVSTAATIAFSINNDQDDRTVSGSGTNAMRDAAHRTNFKNALKSGVNVITCAVGQSGAGSSDLFFDLELKIGVNAKRETPAYVVPAGLAAVYGQKLADIILPDRWSWVDAATPVGNAGTQKHKARFTPENTERYSVVTVDVSVAVAKADPAYSPIDPDDVTAVYGQTLADAKLPECWSWMVPETSVGDVGVRTHKAKYTPNDNVNYNVLTNVDVPITVRKANPNYVVPTGKAAVYGQTLADIALPSGWSWEGASGTTVGSVGTQTHKASFTPSNVASYNVVTGIDVSVTVSKADGLAATQPDAITIPNVDVKTNSYNLSGIALNKTDHEALTYTLGTFVNADGILNATPTITGSVLSYTGAGKASGAATLTVKITSRNYADITVAVTFEATRATKTAVTIGGLTAGGNIVYDGTGKLGVTGTATSGDYKGNLLYTYTGTGITGLTATQPVNVGAYALTVSVPVESAEYTGSQTYTFDIIKAKITKPAVTNGALVYAGGTLSAGIAENAAYTVTGNSAVNAGSYTAKVVLKDTANYSWADGTTAPLSLAWSIGKASYDMSKISLTATAVYGQQLKEVALPESWIWVSPSASAGNAGVREHNAKLANIDAANYKEETGIVSVSVTVAKASVAKPAVASVSRVYNGNAQSAGIAANAAYTLTGDSQTKAGDYIAKAVLKDKVNYEWADGTTADLSLSWSIAKAAGTFGSPAAVSAVYAPALTLSNLALPANYVWNAPETVLNAGNGQSFAATYTDPSGNYSGAGGSVVVNVAKASYSMSGITFADKTVTYNGAAQSIQIGGTLPSGVTVSYGGNGKTEAGTYTVVAAFAVADAANYNVPASMTAKLTVAKATYAITVNGGASDNASAAAGATVTVTAAAAPSGKVFDKWTTAVEGVTFAAVDAAATTFVMPAKAVTVTATYKDKPTTSTSTYTITFNPGDGTVSPLSDKTGTDGKLASLPVPARVGYTFGGWFKGDTQVSASTVFDADAVINAKWAPVSHTITYNLNGGTAETANPASYTVETAGFALNNPVKAGYEFAGWTGSNGATPEMFVSVEYGTAGGNKSYTANWTLITYEVTFNAGGGTVTPASAMTGTGGKLSSLPNPAARTGYTFEGWFLGDNTKVSTSTVFDGDAVLYAQWTPVRYTITYNLNGGTVNPANPESYTIETAGFALNNPTKAAGVFNGWTGSNGTLPEKVVSVGYGAAGGNRSYTANWEFVAYTVTFNAGGGTVSAETVKTGDGGTLASLPTAVKAGYTFDGWYTEAVGGVAVTAGTVFDRNATVYARWAVYDDAVASPGRVIPSARPGEETAAVSPVSRLTAKFTAGPSPASKDGGKVAFFWPTAVKSGMLYVFDANGSAVAKIAVKPGSGKEIGVWNLKDSRGAAVAYGSYAVKGVLIGKDGKRENVRALVAVVK